MLKKRRIFLLVICFATLCLSVAPAMADFVELWAYDTKMTVTATDDIGMAATTTIEARAPGTSYMDMFIKDDGGNELQSLITEPYDLTATLDFTGSGNDYSATGSLWVRDDTYSTKIAADFVSTMLTFNSSYSTIWPAGWTGTLWMTGYLTPQGTNPSILLGDSPWKFEGANETISLADPSSFTHGSMVVLEYIVQFKTFQEFLAVVNADGSGMLIGQIHSTPIPAALLLGVIGLGVVGLKLRKYA